MGMEAGRKLCVWGWGQMVECESKCGILVCHFCARLAKQQER